MPQGIKFRLWSIYGMTLSLVIASTFADSQDAKGEYALSLSHEIRARIEPPEKVSSPPHITSKPIKMSVSNGSTVTFPCKVQNQAVWHFINNICSPMSNVHKSTGSNVVLWKRGQTHTLFAGTVQVDNDQSLELQANNTLQISSVQLKHAGTYICRISSSQPMDLLHILEVLVPPQVTIEPSNGIVVVKKDDSVTLKCRAEGFPVPVITWNSLKGHLPSGISEKHGNVLTIPSVDIDHAGSYQCKADNGIGDPAIAVFKVRVFYSPEISVEPAWVHAGIDMTVEFSCTVSAEPPASVRWTRSNGSQLDKDDNVIILTNGGRSDVKIKRVTEEHFGSYYCLANNTIGSNNNTVKVSGLAEPANFGSDPSGEKETSFLLLWTVKSYSPIIEYLLRIRRKKEVGADGPTDPWTEVMIPVESEQSVLHSQSYNITGLQSATAYEALIQARNKYGFNHPTDTFTFYTYGQGQLQDVMEEQPMQPTTLLDPTTNRQEDQEENISENNLDQEVRNGAAVDHTSFRIVIQTFIAFFAVAFSWQS